MTLSVGIVGLPNVGKSTLFNAITNANVDAANYPFCTIEPNKGIVAIPDERLVKLGEMSQSQKIIYATIEFTDIAGLVKGAANGEGLGNKFLSHIRNVAAIVEVIRCFEDPNITHVNGEINPINDLETIDLELIYADYELAEKIAAQLNKKIKSNNKEDAERLTLIEKIKEQLSKNLPIRELNFTEKETVFLKEYQFLTNKPIIYVANCEEQNLGKEDQKLNPLINYLAAKNIPVIFISAKLEAELTMLTEEERKDYLTELGVDEPGLNKLTKTAFSLLGLQTYLTTGPKETRAWTIQKGDTAPKAAGVIHTDFEKGFIRANVISYDDFVKHSGWKAAKEKGLVRQEGKDYIMQEGDIVEFLFNV
ncbi:MAG: redox-regulated ATPase YchF [Candidatus Margulisiibacteriota bacterium]|jgi:hypothetical protein